MAAPAGWLLLGLLGLSTSLPGQLDGNTSPALQLWEKGQAAMRRGKPAEAVEFYEQSLAADAGMVRNYLSLAAAYLEMGDDAKACPHLARYVACMPEHLSIRLHYAELLLRLQLRRKAQAEFEQFIASAQEQGGPVSRNLIHCHSQLMEIAEAEEDEYGEHLNRGIGLYLLARERADLPDHDGCMSYEGLLCKAARELALARERRPEEARPCWYLSQVWRRLAQRHLELRWLWLADEAAPFSLLTQEEKRELTIACLNRLSEKSCK